MAEKSIVATTLNKITDPAFMAALSSRDQMAMSDLVADFFCGDPDTDMSDVEDEEEPVKWQLAIHCS